ncbi:MAG: DUF4363 family protein [[Clostridium] cellulosi]
MIKNLKTAIIILAAILLLICSSHIYLNSSAQRIADIINSAEKSAIEGNIDAAFKQIDAFESEWAFNKHVYATFIRHAEIDLANQSAAKLRAYLKDEDRTDFIAECETLRMQIKHIAESDRFSLDNIF